MLFTDTKTALHAKLRALPLGESFDFTANEATAETLRDVVQKYGRNWNMHFDCEIRGNALRITAIADPGKRAPGRPPLPAAWHKYPIADLAVGASILLPLPRSEHAKVRRSVSARASESNMRFTCRAEADGIRVTRTA